jgi:phospholipase C
MGLGTLAASLPTSISRALAIPANNRRGSIEDVEHIVILMQENRSFDHYFGTLRGVRGFNDPRAVNLPSGKSVWYQPNGAGEVLPFRPAVDDVGSTFLPDPPHGWNDTHAAWNGGQHDQWVPNKGVVTMTYETRKDIPYHYALADAFTICDAYHCSVLGPTDPNRYHMWTGWVGNDGAGGGPVITNAELGYDWSTFPERLEQAGISWKIYQDIGHGLNAEGFWGWTFDEPYTGNYGDNSLLYFHQYQNALFGTPLADKAKTGTNILANNRDVFSKTAMFLNYDEEGGFFDHQVPPTPPQSSAHGYSTVATTNEIFPGDSSHPSGPYGLGMRVPMIVISPWSKGGFVNSQVFDHTSLIRFIEKRFGDECHGLLDETNITPWRRAVVGDLTSAFDFEKHAEARRILLPGTDDLKPSDFLVHPDFKPVPPAGQSLPEQEIGVRPARALPYALDAHGEIDASGDFFKIDFGNSGRATAVFQVRSGSSTHIPRTYTVEPHKSLSDTWGLASLGVSVCDLSVYGPNGFLRAFKGTVQELFRAQLDVRADCDEHENGFTLSFENRSSQTARVSVLDKYTGKIVNLIIKRKDTESNYWSLRRMYGWYDFVIKVDGGPGIEYEFAGHIETGEDSISDPLLGGVLIGDDVQKTHDHTFEDR